MTGGMDVVWLFVTKLILAFSPWLYVLDDSDVQTNREPE